MRLREVWGVYLERIGILSADFFGREDEGYEGWGCGWKGQLEWLQWRYVSPFGVCIAEAEVFQVAIGMAVLEALLSRSSAGYAS